MREVILWHSAVFLIGSLPSHSLLPLYLLSFLNGIPEDEEMGHLKAFLVVPFATRWWCFDATREGTMLLNG